MTEVFLLLVIMNNFLYDLIHLPLEDWLKRLNISESIGAVWKLFLVFMVISLGISLLSRLIFGRGSGLARAVSTTISILEIYIITVVIYIVRLWSLESLLTPLPYVSFCAQALVIHPFEGLSFNDFAVQAVDLIILAFIVLLSSRFLSNNRNHFLWVISQSLSLILSMLLHLVSKWVLTTYIPSAVTSGATITLFVILLISFFGGLSKFIFSLFLASINPIIGFLYNFFFGNRIGKLLSLSILTAAFVTVLFSIIEYYGYAVILIGPSDLISYIPLLFILFFLWVLVGYEL